MLLGDAVNTAVTRLATWPQVVCMMPRHTPDTCVVVDFIEPTPMMFTPNVHIYIGVKIGVNTYLTTSETHHTYPTCPQGNGDGTSPEPGSLSLAVSLLLLLLLLLEGLCFVAGQHIQLF